MGGGDGGAAADVELLCLLWVASLLTGRCAVSNPLMPAYHMAVCARLAWSAYCRQTGDQLEKLDVLSCEREHPA